MKTLLDQSTREEIIRRIEQINPETQPAWGKMSAAQMLKHCAIAEQSYLGQLHVPRSFIGRIVGKKALAQILSDDSPIGRNAKTKKRFIVTGEADFQIEQARWIDLIRQYERFKTPFVMHWFFGKMSREQIGYFAYKHADHHLRQFNS